MDRISILPARTQDQYLAAKSLFIEYSGHLSFSLCFQHFDEELESLKQLYGPPSGELLLAVATLDEVIGAVGLKKLDERCCEMKRLYVLPSARGLGAGQKLVNELIRCARDLGYQKMKLDTLAAEMGIAVAIYRQFGFVEIPAYYDNPLSGVLFMELDLNLPGRPT